MTRMSLCMKRMAPMGIMFYSQRYQIIGRILHNLQTICTGGKDAASKNRLKGLMEFPTEDDENFHWLFCYGGPIFAHLRERLVDLKDRCMATYNVGLHPLHVPLRAALAAMFRERAGEGVQLPPVIKMEDLVRATVRALEESALDTDTECQSYRVPRPNSFLWPDREEDGTCPVWTYIRRRLEADALPWNYCEDGDGLIVGLDGSKSSDGAGYAVVIYKISKELMVNGLWMDRLVPSEDKENCIKLSSSIPRFLGTTEVASFETEAYALLVALMKVWRHLHRCLIFSDAKSLLVSLAQMVQVSGSMNPIEADRVTRSRRCAHLWRLLVHQWRMSNGLLREGEGDIVNNPFYSAVTRWANMDDLDGKFELFNTSLAGGIVCHIKSHQMDGNGGMGALDNGGTRSRLIPCKAAVHINHLADQEAKVASMCAITEAVKIPVGAEDITCVLHGRAVIGNPGVVIREKARESVVGKLAGRNNVHRKDRKWTEWLGDYDNKDGIGKFYNVKMFRAVLYNGTTHDLSEYITEYMSVGGRPIIIFK